MYSKIAQALILVTINHLYQRTRTTELKAIYKCAPTYMFGNLIAIIMDLLNTELHMVYFNLGQMKGT